MTIDTMKLEEADDTEVPVSKSSFTRLKMKIEVFS